MPTCKTCEGDYFQRGGDPTLLEDECMACELERLRTEVTRQHDALDAAAELLTRANAAITRLRECKRAVQMFDQLARGGMASCDFAGYVRLIAQVQRPPEPGPHDAIRFVKAKEDALWAKAHLLEGEGKDAAELEAMRWWKVRELLLEVQARPGETPGEEIMLTTYDGSKVDEMPSAGDVCEWLDEQVAEFADNDFDEGFATATQEIATNARDRFLRPPPAAPTCQPSTFPSGAMERMSRRGDTGTESPDTDWRTRAERLREALADILPSLHTLGEGGELDADETRGFQVIARTLYATHGALLRDTEGDGEPFRGYNDPGHDTDWPCPHHRAPEQGCEPCSDLLAAGQHAPKPVAPTPENTNGQTPEGD